MALVKVGMGAASEGESRSGVRGGDGREGGIAWRWRLQKGKSDSSQSHFDKKCTVTQ